MRINNKDPNYIEFRKPDYESVFKYSRYLSSSYYPFIIETLQLINSIDDTDTFYLDKNNPQECIIISFLEEVKETKKVHCSIPVNKSNFDFNHLVNTKLELHMSLDALSHVDFYFEKTFMSLLKSCFYDEIQQILSQVTVNLYDDKSKSISIYMIENDNCVEKVMYLHDDEFSFTSTATKYLFFKKHTKEQIPVTLGDNLNPNLECHLISLDDISGLEFSLRSYMHNANHNVPYSVISDCVKRQFEYNPATTVLFKIGE